jgi:glycogen operon protein
LSWHDWALADSAGGRALRAYVARLLALRREQPVLRQPTFFAGRRVHSDGTTDLAWFGPDGLPLDHPRWNDPALRGLQMFLHGGPVGGDSLLVVVHGDLDDGSVRLPGPPWATSWTLLWDSTDETPLAADGPTVSAAAGGEVVVTALSTRVYRAER